MNITGTIIKIGATKEVGQKKFKTRELVVKTDEQYPQEIPVVFVQDKTEILNNFSEGQEVTVDINLRGRSYEKNGDKRWFSEINGWRISKRQTTASDQQPGREPAKEEEDYDDLPF